MCHHLVTAVPLQLSSEVNANTTYSTLPSAVHMDAVLMFYSKLGDTGDSNPGLHVTTFCIN